MRRKRNVPEPSFNGSMFSNPNVNTHFWKERCSNENQHKYKSNVKGIYLGKLTNVPVTNDFAQNVTKRSFDNPLSILEAIRSEESFRKDKFPGKSIFGAKSSKGKLVLPIEKREFNHFSDRKMEVKKSESHKSSVKTYDEPNQMSWMTTSIKLSQPEIKRFQFFKNKNVERKPYQNNEKSIVPENFEKDHNISNYDYLSKISHRNNSVENILERRSKILQSTARGRIEKSPHHRHQNKSMVSGRVNHQSMMSPITPYKNLHHSINKEPLRNTPRQSHMSLKSKYKSKMGYIQSAIGL
ncbi:unnamed protein product [Moneuplotes crassus]|uniref:Uncharacterized protein n=1 Tax=Euplotes crassus TaxID=5936 RepID=A0AAD2D0C4_EUPCR|nr:unnamed protein product [Moneuplotes crassus]